VCFVQAVCARVLVCLRVSRESVAVSVSTSMSASVAVSVAVYLCLCLCLRRCLFLRFPMCLCRSALCARGGGLGSSTIFKKFHEPYAPS